MKWARIAAISVVGLLLGSSGAFAAPDDTAAQARSNVLNAEAGFWTAFNRCDAAAMAGFFTPDAEFYHDQTGLTTTRERVTASMMTGPCSNLPDQRMRREAVAGTERFDMLAGGYAMLSGQQRFFLGADRTHNSIAGYVEIWQKVGAGWQMKRVVSYAHQPETHAH